MNGTHTKVNSEAVTSMRRMRDELESLSTQLKSEIGKLENAYLENKEYLGPHSDDILKLLEALGVAAEEADAPVKVLRKKLFASAVMRDNMISNNPYGRSK